MSSLSSALLASAPRASWLRPAACGLLLACSSLNLGACGPEKLGQVVPDILLEEQAVDFGKLPVLNIGEHALTMINRGQAPLKLIEAKISGDDAAFFSADPLPTEVASGASDLLLLHFRPEEERVYSASLLLRSNDPDSAELGLTLKGEGDTIAAIEVEPASINFGLVGEGQTAVEGFTIRSVGSAPLIVESVRFGDGSSAAFVPVGSWSQGQLAIGASIPLSVGFAPTPATPGATGSIEIVSTDPLRRTVSVSLDAEVNHAPLAFCPDQELLGAPGDVMTLDGTGSSDPDGHLPLSYQWQVVQRPINSNTDLSDPGAITTTLALDVPGRWEVQLCVTDALGVESLSCCRTNLRAVPAEKLYVELVWDSPQTDLDLHLLAPGAVLNGAGDCNWGNPTPDFGIAGDPSDDPVLARDDLAGFGPEIIRYKDPPVGSFQIVVDFPKDNGAIPPVTQATLRVYEFGVIAAEIGQQLDVAHTRWSVGSVAWPSGEVSADGTLTPY